MRTEMQHVTLLCKSNVPAIAIATKGKKSGHYGLMTLCILTSNVNERKVTGSCEDSDSFGGNSE